MINRYLGYWDGNPTTLIPLSPEDSTPLYVEMMGGAEPILARGKELYDKGKYGVKKGYKVDVLKRSIEFFRI